MINIIPYNLFEMSKIKLQDYYPYLQKIEDLVRSRDYEKYANFPENWYVSIDYDLTYFKNFIETNKDINKYASVQLFCIEIFYKVDDTTNTRVYYARFNQDTIVIKRSIDEFAKSIDNKKLPLETIKDPHRFFKRVIEEIKEMEQDV
jgi:hypothetical protein